MKRTRLKGVFILLAAVFTAGTCLLWVIDLIDYLGQSPNDSGRIWLYIATIVGLATAATMYYILWIKRKDGE
jgi:hypothetical protein